MSEKPTEKVTSFTLQVTNEFISKITQWISCCHCGLPACPVGRSAIFFRKDSRQAGMTENGALPVTSLGILIAFFLLTFSLLSIQSVPAQESPCLGCHGQFRKPAKAVHAALGMGCETCHQAVEGKKHPEKGSMKLTQEVPGLCNGCHDQTKFKGKVAHSPVAGGMCTSCHNPHQSETPKLLTSDQPELCYGCHDKKEFTKKNVHAAVMMGCASCHNAHAGDNPGLLTRPINALCISCHAAVATGRHVMSIPGKGFHPVRGKPDPGRPGKEMSCASCHNPHSSDFKKLFPSGDLCGKCHKF